MSAAPDFKVKKNIVLLGASGSIGTSALDVVRQFPGRFKVVGLSVNSNIEKCEAITRAFRPRTVAVADASRAKDFRVATRCRVQVLAGREGLCRLAAMKEADVVVIAIVGSEAIFPLRAAIRAGKTIALANKEAVVVAGPLVMAEARRYGARIIPIDSEQSAIFQCLQGYRRSMVERIYLTASGGPLADYSAARMARVSLKKVLAHPRWNMGRKITVDSATLMNKGLEVIEAQQIFGLPLEKIKVVIHRQALVHSMVAFVDGSVLAQLGITDMRLPIQYALTYPERWPNRRFALDPARMGELTFASPDPKRFPCLALAYAAAKTGGRAPCVLNAANEEAVRAFLDGRLAFYRIADVVATVLGRGRFDKGRLSLDDIFRADAWAREEARREIASYPQGGR